MNEQSVYDVIVIGGSYAGLAAAMTLGRSLRNVLIIDGGKPCNKQTPHSHNFLTQDGKAPGEIAILAKQQVEKYETVRFYKGDAIKGIKNKNGFEIHTGQDKFVARKLIFATGIMDILPDIEGIKECWGISVLHCPYCHGYEARNQNTGILGNGERGFEFSVLISNWTKDLTLFTNGKSALTIGQTAKLDEHRIKTIEKEIEKFVQSNGILQKIVFKDGSTAFVQVLYAPSPFQQHCQIPFELGCELTDEGYIKTDLTQKTNIYGIYACGDSTSRLRTVANAVATGATAGMMVNKEIILEQF